MPLLHIGLLNEMGLVMGLLTSNGAVIPEIETCVEYSDRNETNLN